jgi:hypothetical protein
MGVKRLARVSSLSALPPWCPLYRSRLRLSPRCTRGANAAPGTNSLRAHAFWLDLRPCFPIMEPQKWGMTHVWVTEVPKGVNEP